MKSVEKSGRSADLAIALALEDLGLTREQVQVDILQIESSGILGIFGRKDAKVRVTPLSQADSVEPRARRKPAGRGRGEGKPVRPPKPRPEPKAPERKKPRESAPVQAEPVPQRSEKQEFAAGEMSTKAAEILGEISRHFGLDLEIRGEEDDRTVNLHVSGEDIGQLIGRRGHTLSSVQYILGRLINEEKPVKKKINIDVDGYQETREQAIRELAEKGAEKVMETGRPFTLRPMPSPERRIIHLELQEHDEVATESCGEDSRRFVIIYAKSMDKEELIEYMKTAEPGPPRRSQGQGGRGRDSRRGRDRGRR